MPTPDLHHLDWLARIDAVQSRLIAWASQPVMWEPLRPAQALIRRLLERMEPLRIRWDAPLVVATFGGTGTGKSTLVNALVGAEVSPAGKQRPTTLRPVLLAHPDTDLSVSRIPLDRVEVVRRDLPLLRDVILLDCPDPDTSETDGAATNLGRLHDLLPFCDVLLTVSTQQKYRSAKVGDELGKAAESCRLVFIQTHAGTDDDIRDDWRKQLEPQYRMADLFFVDSRRALAEQQQGQHPSGDFGRLLSFLARELSAARRTGIRRANLLDLLDQGLQRCLRLVEPELPALEQLDQAIRAQRRRLGELLAAHLTAELSSCRSLWERRLMARVTQTWGVSPFGALLRLYQAQAMLLASWSFFRARNTAQLALWGAWQGSRWLGEQQTRQSDEQRLQHLAEPGLDPAEYRVARMTLAGHLHAAQLQIDRESPSAAEGHAMAGPGLLADVSRRVDEIVSQLARRNSGWFARAVYETGFLLLPAFLLYRIGRNFFYDSFWHGEPLLDVTFYIPALLFLGLWSACWLWRFLARLQRGRQQAVLALSQDLCRSPAWEALFADVDAARQSAQDSFQSLRQLHHSVAALRQTLETDTHLSGRQPVP